MRTGRPNVLCQARAKWSEDALLAADEHRRVLRRLAIFDRHRTDGSAFVREHPGSRVRIVGEPIWAERTDEEYPACAEHEALINVALGESPVQLWKNEPAFAVAVSVTAAPAG